MPNLFENAGPRCHADAGADEDGNFVVEDVLSGSAVGSINLDLGHFLASLKGDLVDAIGVE